MISIIIINFNTFETTSQCITSIIEHTTCEYEIVLVDNASTECNPELFKLKFPTIKLVKSQFNSGFAAGNNLGISESSGEVLLLLNSDTILTEDAISKTLHYLELHNEIGVIGCRMSYPDNSLQFTARRFRSIWWELLDIFRFILWLIPYKQRAKLMLGKYFNSDFNTSCDWLNGAFFMFRKDILSKLPNQKLDERFFMYGEDHLWCWQIQQLGYMNFFLSETSIVHISGGSSSLEKQLKLRDTMKKHELEIMKLRKGSGLYFILFSILFETKERVRNSIKQVVFKISGKLLR